jgi:alanyl-tRNA synthetase
MMLFGEKYPDPVRMVSMGDFSKELCGGTHLDNTSEVESFEILSEEGISAGTRRITALTGARAREHAARIEATLQEIATLLNTAPGGVSGAVRALSQRVRDMKKELSGGSKASSETIEDSGAAGTGTLDYRAARAALRETARLLNVAPFDIPARVRALRAEAAELEQQIEQLAQTGDISADTLLAEAVIHEGVRVVVRELAGATPNLMRQLIDQLRKKSDEPVAALLAARQGGDKVVLVAGVSQSLVERNVKAGDWVRQVAPVVGGGGGGKPDMAQAGGKDPEKIPDACAKAIEVIRQMLLAS